MQYINQERYFRCQNLCAIINMPTSKPTKAKADELIAALKVVPAQVSWYSVPTGWRLKTRVFITELREILDLRGFIGNTNHSFVLLYQNYPIRKYTKHVRHTVGDQVFTKPHKHLWDEMMEDANAYYPDDIDPNADINDQFLSFCNECNIQLLGAYQRVTY